MQLNHDTSIRASSNHSNETSNEVYNYYPISRYGVPDSMPQSQSIVNNMMYYQGIYVVK